MLRRIHIVGTKNAGKTTLVVDLVRELTRRGLKVGTIKHTSHAYELDHPGKDSHQHRSAGASPAAVVSGGLTAIFLPTPEGDAVYDALEPHYGDCDIVLVEGDRNIKAPKLEVWRKSSREKPMAAEMSDILAIVTDENCDLPIRTFPRCDLTELCDQLVSGDMFSNCDSRQR